MGDELYLRRMPLHSLVTLLLFQVLPGGWGKRVLSRWLVTVPPGMRPLTRPAVTAVVGGYNNLAG